MAVTRVFNDIHDSGSGYVTTPVNYGPYTVPADFTLVKVEWNGVIENPPASVTNVLTTYFFSLAFGIQFVANGGTPLDIETADKNKDQWIFCGNPLYRSYDSFTTISNQIDAASINAFYGIDGSWRGQRPLPQALDFYVSTGIFFGSAVTYRLFMNLTLTYSD